MAALAGGEGLSFDALLLSAALTMHHLGRSATLKLAAEEVRDVLLSGRAAARV